MCVVAVKYLKDYGWVGAKNRDRNYQTEVEIVQSNRNDIQRLYIDDQLSRWTEGLNEFGVSIISASFSVKSDEKEGEKVAGKSQKRREEPNYYSPDGRDIRNALMRDNPLDAVKFLVSRELAGATFVFDENTCYLLEGGFTVRMDDETADNPREYHYKVTEIPRDRGMACRTNHGINLPQLGYKKDADDEYIIRSRMSSEKRYGYTKKFIAAEMTNPSELIDALARTPDEDRFMNPIRTGDPKKGDMVTTGQLLLVPKERTLHYRPIYSAVSFKYDKLNGPKAKTFFEIISSRSLLSFQEYFSNPEKEFLI